MLVLQKNGRIKIFAINVNSRDIELTISAVKLEEFDVINTAIHKKKVHCKSNTSSIIDSRVKELESCLKLAELNEEGRDSLLTSIKKYSFQFKLKNDKLGGTDLVQHRIITTDEQPINKKMYRPPQVHKDEIQKQVKELLDNDGIKVSVSPYNSPVWVVPKTTDSEGKKRWRMVIDYRKLNEKI